MDKKRQYVKEEDCTGHQYKSEPMNRRKCVICGHVARNRTPSRILRSNTIGTSFRKKDTALAQQKEDTL